MYNTFIFRIFKSLIINLLGILYPGFSTIKSIEKKRILKEWLLDNFGKLYNCIFIFKYNYEIYYFLFLYQKYHYKFIYFYLEVMDVNLFIII